MLERPVMALPGGGMPGLTVEGTVISASDGAGVTLVVDGAGQVSCDVKTVQERTAADWAGLIGPEPFALAQLASRELGEGVAVAATRVWSAVESLLKVGQVLPGPLTLDQGGGAGWALFRSGQSKIATFATRLRGEPGLVIFAIQTEGDGSESVLRIPAHHRFRRNQPGGQRLLCELRPLAGPLPRDVPARARARRAR
jgi:enediyne polyketide synthase